MEEKKAKRMFIGSSSARDEDMISKLPYSLISQILSYLTTKEVVRTSVLSNRWRNLWLLIPRLDLDSDEFSDYNAFASFIDRFIDFSREENSCLDKLKLSIHKDENKNDQSCVTRWIDFVAKTRKLKHLDVQCFVNRQCLEVMPLSLFICEALLALRLDQVLFGSFKESSVSLPRLKTLRLEHNIYANERSLDLLISSCPVLEDLSIVRRFDDNVKVLRVRSQTLTSLSIKYYLIDEEKISITAGEFDLGQFGILIDAPRLEYLNFDDLISVSKTVINSGSLTKVNLQVRLEGSDDDEVREFFASFSRVRDMGISMITFLYIKDIVQLPKFCNLSSLEAELASFYMKKLPMLLASCPNLKSLILDLVIDSFASEQVIVWPVLQCMLSSLEFVEIKCDLITDLIMELVRYFTKNSVILKKLVLRLKSSTLEGNAVGLRDLLALPRRSSTCQIIVC